MKYWKIGLGAVGVIWFGALAYAAFYIFAPADNSLGLTTSSTGKTTGHYAGSIGLQRHRMLVEATKAYSRSRSDVPRAIAEGKAFAPVPFLNRELERHGATWRVRSTDKLDAEIYEIS